MILAREALRMTAVRALRGKTWAGDRVYDSHGGPVDDVAFDSPTPVILVFTDDSERESDRVFTSQDLGGSVVQTLIIETLISQRQKIPLIDGDGNPIVDPATGRVAVVLDPEGNPYFETTPLGTDAALEWRVGAMQRQAHLALQGPGTWQDLFKRLCIGFKSRADQRGTSDRDGSRFAGRQLTLACQMIAEPEPGEPTGVWADFCDALEDEGGQSVAIAEEFRELIRGRWQDWTEAERTRAALGYSQDVQAALGMDSPDPDAVAVEQADLVDADS
jgi:hypothetical protein